jgi:YVTN family beta-propeller protein
MNIRISWLLATSAFALAGIIDNGQSLAQNAYITNFNSNTVSVIDTATNTVTATIPVDPGPQAFGIFIQPAPRFAGTSGYSNCHGQSVAALAQQYQGLNSAAAALGYPNVQALPAAIRAFCGG